MSTRSVDASEARAVGGLDGGPVLLAACKKTLPDYRPDPLSAG